jgi:D-glycero-D-manno-heptose 1,7-bisphosphate phosphatase
LDKIGTMDDDSPRPTRTIQFVFLDRDGVINRKPSEDRTISRWEDFDILPGVEEAIARLNATGRKVIVITNQRGIALGKYTEKDLEMLHARLREHLAQHHAHIDAIYYCPHDRGVCDCRKPGPGMFEQAFRDFPQASGINSVMIGDSISDIEAGVRLGMRTIFIQGDPAFQKPGADRAAALAMHLSYSLKDAVWQLIDPLPSQ